jgi:hypothetical protein
VEEHERFTTWQSEGHFTFASERLFSLMSILEEVALSVLTVEDLSMDKVDKLNYYSRIPIGRFQPHGTVAGKELPRSLVTSAAASSGDENDRRRKSHSEMHAFRTPPHLLHHI